MTKGKVCSVPAKGCFNIGDVHLVEQVLDLVLDDAVPPPLRKQPLNVGQLVQNAVVVQTDAAAATSALRGYHFKEYLGDAAILSEGTRFIGSSKVTKKTFYSACAMLVHIQNVVRVLNPRII